MDPVFSPLPRPSAAPLHSAPRRALCPASHQCLSSPTFKLGFKFLLPCNASSLFPSISESVLIWRSDLAAVVPGNWKRLCNVYSPTVKFLIEPWNLLSSTPIAWSRKNRLITCTMWFWQLSWWCLQRSPCRACTRTPLATLKPFSPVSHCSV